MNKIKGELVIARTILIKKAEIIADRENREQRIREKAVRAFEERREPKKQRKPMTAEERVAVMKMLKRLNAGKEDSND